MTEQIVESMIRAKVDTDRHRLVPRGERDAETVAVPSEPVNVSWRLHGQGQLVGEGRKTLAERLDDAYRDDDLRPNERGLLDRAANQLGRRLSNEE